MKSRTEYFFHNSSAMALQQIVAMLTAFFIPRILLEAYGSEINGLVVSITQFVTYFLLVEGGLSGASIYALYKPLADRDIPRINAILSAARHFYFQSGYIFLALVCLLAAGYPFFSKGAMMPPWQIALMVCAIGGKGIVDFFSLSKYRVLLTASQHSYVISAAQIAYYLLTAALVWLLARHKLQIVWLQCFLILPLLLRTYILHRYTRTHFNYVNYQVPPDYSSIKDRWSVFYVQVLGSVQTSLPIILATVFTSLALVSVYSIYNLVAAGMDAVLGIFISGLSASFGDVIARKQRKTLQRASQEFEQTYYMIITTIYSTAAWLIIPFIKLYTQGIHDTNYIFPWLGFLFICNSLFAQLKSPQGMLVLAAGKYRETQNRALIQAIIGAVGGTIGAVFWGLYGILVGAICASLYRIIDLLFFSAKHITRLSYVRTLRRQAVVLGVFFISGTMSFLFPLAINSVLQWVLWGVLLSLTSALAVILVNFLVDAKNMMHIWERLKKLTVSLLNKHPQNQ